MTLSHGQKGAAPNEASTTSVPPIPGSLSRLWHRVVHWFYIDERDVKDRSSHWAYLGICAVFLLLPFLLSVEGGAGRVTAFGINLPGMCLSRELLRARCPGCGLTRSFVALVHGRLYESFSYHRLGAVLYLFFASQAVWRVYCLANMNRQLPPLLLRGQSWLGLTITAALILNWLVGFVFGGN